MKKILALAIAFVFLTTILSGCTPFWKKEAFSLNYKLSEATVDYFTQNDTAEMLSCGNPLYAGAQPLPFEGTKGYEKLRAQKVDYIMTQSDELVKITNDTSADFDKLRSFLLKYLDVVLKEEKDSGTYVRDVFLTVSKFKTARAVANAKFTTLRSSNPQNKFAKAYFDYQATLQAIEYANLTLKDAEWIFKYAAITMQQLEGRNNPVLMEAAKVLDEGMGDTAVQRKLAKVFEIRDKICYAFTQIESADYYFANASSAFIKDNLPILREKAATIKPANENDTSPQFINEYLDYFEAVNNETKGALDNQDKKFIISVDNVSNRNTVYAINSDGFNYYEKTEKVLNQAPKTEKPPEGYLTSGFSAVKSACSSLKTGIGVGVDVIGTAVNNVNSIGLGLYYGGANQQSINDIGDHINEGYEQFTKNYQNNMSGVETFKTATEYFNTAEETGGDIAEGTVEKTIGKGYTSWFAGGIGKLTVGMFTGLGKGISMVSNKQATAGETAEGAINISFSFIGGSKALINGKNALTTLKAGSEAGTKLAKDGIIYTGEKLFAADVKKLSKESAAILLKKQITEQEAYKLISNSLSIEANQLVRAEINANRAKLAEEFAKILKEGGKVAIEETKTRIKNELMEKLAFTFEKNISGLMDAIKINIGGSLGGFADNLVGGWIDNGLSAVIGTYVNQIVGTITMDDLVGTYTGTIIINEGSIAPGVAKNNKVSFDIVKTGDYTGTMGNMSVGENSTPLAFTLTDGTISCQNSLNGATTKYDITASRIENKVILKGTMVTTWGEKLRITADITVEK